MKITKIILIFTFFLSNSCGYKPIYYKNDQLIAKFNEIILEGEDRINRQIIDNLSLKIDFSSNQTITLKTNYIIEETSKSSKGQVETYRSIINTELTIKDGKEIIKFRNISADTSYNNKDNKFELTKYQNEVKNNLINRISEEIILILNLQ